jgi:hypothetical protein
MLLKQLKLAKRKTFAMKKAQLMLGFFLPIIIPSKQLR